MAHLTNAKRKRIFVAMPFRALHDGIFSVLRDAADLVGADVIRLDEQSFSGSIISQIRAEIEGADLLTAIVSEENGNVYYEIGLAHCQRKPVVLLTSDPSTLKFDLRDHRAITYDPRHPEGVRDELARTLNAAMNVTSDPHTYMASVFGGAEHSHAASELGLQKAVETLAAMPALHLQRPVRLKRMELLQDTREMAIVVEDFMGASVRAVIDINGIISKFRHVQE